METEKDNKQPPVFTDDERVKFSWLLNRCEQNQARYMFAEKFLLEIVEMPWWKRLFKLPSLIIKYFDFVHNKWN